MCGRRKERFPEASVYNLLADMEWNTPLGEADACGGGSQRAVTAPSSCGCNAPRKVASASARVLSDGALATMSKDGFMAVFYRQLQTKRRAVAKEPFRFFLFLAVFFIARGVCKKVL